jgi:hypothetical protein
MRLIFTEPGARNELGRATMLGVNFAVGMATFSFLGYWIDGKRGEGAIFFTLLGVLLGLGYGAYETWIVIRELNAKAMKATEGRKDTPSAPEPGDGLD